MIPAGGMGPATIETVPYPSRTWRLDLNQGRIRGMVDGLASVQQSVYKILNTERFHYLIYSANYGHELGVMVGKSDAYVRSELTRLITEALSQDDRIQGIEHLTLEGGTGDDLTVAFIVVSDLGSFSFSQEVS